MATQEDQVGGKCKQRFKGIENFLRRVAFNLGNSPSQTEVKIISCIPIDVSDLQQKIIQLEKQLEEVSCQSKTPTPASKAQLPTVVNTAQTTIVNTVQNTGVNTAQNTVVYTAQKTAEFGTRCECVAGATDICCTQPPRPDVSTRRSALSIIIPSVLSQCSRVHPKKQCQRSAPIRSHTEQAKINLSVKSKKAKNPEHLIYYAQTTASPFTNYKREVAARKGTQKTGSPVDQPYVKDLVRKQYGQEMYRLESSSVSALTAPVCRDAAGRAPVARDSDVCSCCRGLFHDLDLDHRPYRFLDATLPTTMTQNIDNGNVYYNSSYYDVIPVKEKPDKAKRESEQITKRDPKAQFQGNCWPENYRTKTECRALMMDYTHTLPTPTHCMKKMPVKYAKRRERPAKRLSFKNDSSRNTVVECGDIYMKRSVAKNPRSKPPHINKPVLLKNAECLTHNVNDTECQTEILNETQPEITASTEENKTESTLNQIKSILQSVLTHVKTNNLVKSQIEQKGRKDAVVQNEGQCNSQERSRLLNSFTYSPFAMDPYVASCSRALPSGHCTPCSVMLPRAADLHTMAPQSHYKCLQNFPVFIQHRPAACPPRPQCPSCCHGSGFRSPSGQPKQTSTNTLPNEEEKRSKETENLIKEIYKSMALNMNIPSKDTSQSDYSYLKSDVSRNQSGEPVISNVMTVGRQMRSRAQNEKARQQSPVSTAVTSRATSSTRTPIESPPEEQRPLRRCNTASTAKRKANKSNVHDSDTTTETLEQTKKTRKVEASASMTNDTTSESETESEDSIATVKKTVKKESTKVGLFSKMFGSVFKKRRRKMKQEESADTAEASEASDSDDYQTIYSQKVEKPKHVTYAPSYRQRSKRSLRPRERPRRVPYMEQEERRYWNEKLTFHAHQSPRQTPERTSVRPQPRGINIRTRPPGIYFQKLEARHALIDEPNPPYTRPNEFNSTRNTLQNEYKSRSPRLSVGLKGSNKRISWLKRYSPKVQCGEQWKKLLLEG